MDLIQAVSLALGVMCVIIGLALVPLGGWFLRNGIKNRDWTSAVISILILALAALAFVGAFNLYAHGIIQMSPYMQGTSSSTRSKPRDSSTCSLVIEMKPVYLTAKPRKSGQTTIASIIFHQIRSANAIVNSQPGILYSISSRKLDAVNALALLYIPCSSVI